MAGTKDAESFARLVRAVENYNPRAHLSEKEAAEVAGFLLGFMADGLKEGAELALIDTHARPTRIRVLKLPGKLKKAN